MNVNKIEVKTNELLREAEESATPSAFYVIKTLSTFIFDLIEQLEQLQEELDINRESK